MRARAAVLLAGVSLFCGSVLVFGTAGMLAHEHVVRWLVDAGLFCLGAGLNLLVIALSSRR